MWAYSSCHVSGDEWKRIWAWVLAEFPNPIFVLAWAVDLKWAQVQSDGEKKDDKLGGGPLASIWTVDKS